MNYLQRSYFETKKKYIKYRRRYEKRLQDGSFKRFTRKQQHALLNRLHRFAEKLKRLELALKLGTAGAAMALTVAALPANAQTVKHKKPFKEIVKQYHKNKHQAKTFTGLKGSDFEQQFGENNPFGGSNPMESVIYSANRTAHVDLDADGDFDLVLATYEGEKLRYIKLSKNEDGMVEADEQTGTDNPFNAISSEIVSPEAISFGDLDGDGDYDLIVADGDLSKITYFQNSGTAQQAEFESDGIIPIDGFPLDSWDIFDFTFADIDNDSDLDMIIGGMEGNIMYYKNTGTPTEPMFQQQTGDDSPFDEIAPNVWTLPRFADLDHDADLDLILGEVYGEARYFENTGTNTEPSFTELSDGNNPFDGLSVGWHFNSVFTDWDIDGDQDMFVSNDDGATYYFENTGTAQSPVFESRNGIMSGNNFNILSFADLDNDGDTDMLVGGYGNYPEIKYYENTGTETNPKFTEQETLIPETFYAWANPKLVDIDNDGDYDCFLGVYDENTYSFGHKLYKNNGTAEQADFEEVSDSENPLAGITGEYDIFLDFADLDNDGDMDCVVGGNDYYGDKVKFYKNTGTPENAEFEPDENHLEGMELGYVAIPTFVDLDMDGDTDLFVGAYQYPDGYQTRYFKNEGTPEELNFVEAFEDDNPFADNNLLSDFNFTDLDADGDPDCVLSIYGGPLYYYKNMAIVADTEAPEIAFTPENGAENIPNDAQLSIVFNEPIRMINDSEITDVNVAELLNLKWVNTNSDIDFSAIINDDKTEITVTPTENLGSLQDYTLELQAIEDESDNATKIASTTFTSGEVVGMESLENISEVSIFPNPVKDVINLKGVDSQNIEIEIFDMTGKFVKDFENNPTNPVLTVSSLQQGVYLLKITEDKQSKIIRFVKQ